MERVEREGISDMISDEKLFCRTYINDHHLIILKLQTQMEFVHALLKSKKFFKIVISKKKIKRSSSLHISYFDDDFLYFAMIKKRKREFETNSKMTYNMRFK